MQLVRSDGVWLASGIHAEAKRRLSNEPSHAVAAELCRGVGDATIVHVATEGGRAVKLMAWRGVSSAFEVFYAVRPDGAILVSDQFRNMLVLLPLADRTPSEEAVLDHFLFRTVPCRRTYSRAIRRLGHGERLTVDPLARTAEISTFDQVPNLPAQEVSSSFFDSLDQAFIDSTRWFGARPGLVSMFSGGVDLSLLQSYLGAHTPAVFYAPQFLRRGTPDLTRYARHAAKLLDLDLAVRELREDDTWAYVERNIDVGGWPQHSIQSVKYGRAFEEEWRGYILGERADALFGAASTRSALVASWAIRRWARLGLQSLARMPIPRLAGRAAGVLQSAAELSRSPDSPEGWAGMSTRGYSDYEILTDIVGPDAVLAALAERLEYVATRLAPAAAQTRLGRHLELAHWIDCLCEDHTTFIRQLGLAHGKSVYLPFLANAVVRMAVSVPADRRYYRGRQVKYLLKDALRRRVPTYPVDQRKGITSMRMPQRYKGADLSALWSEYPIPDFVPRRHHAALAGLKNPMSLPAMTFAMLEKRVLRNPELSLIPGTQIVRRSWS